MSTTTSERLTSELLISKLLKGTAILTIPMALMISSVEVDAVSNKNFLAVNNWLGDVLPNLSQEHHGVATWSMMKSMMLPYDPVALLASSNSL